MRMPTADEVFGALIALLLVGGFILACGRAFMQGLKGEKYKVKPDTPIQKLFEKISTTVGRILTWLIVALVVGGIYLAMNEGGWISHSETTLVDFAPNDWQVGEYRSCRAEKLQRDSKIILFCNGIRLESDFHEMDVKFWGEVPVSKDGRQFKCQRQTDSITCHKPD